MTHVEPSNRNAALWMAGWLAAMLTMAVAGREAVSQIGAFQVMELRALIGMVLLYPLVRSNGGFAAMKTAHPGATRCIMARSSAGWWRSP